MPSVHEVPFVTAVFVQPNAGLQPSAVQTLLSLQLTLWMQPLHRHVSTVQEILSSQLPLQGSVAAPRTLTVSMC